MSGIRSTMYEEIITDSVDKGFDVFFYFFVCGFVIVAWHWGCHTSPRFLEISTTSPIGIKSLRLV